MKNFFIKYKDINIPYFPESIWKLPKIVININAEIAQSFLYVPDFSQKRLTQKKQEDKILMWIGQYYDDYVLAISYADWWNYFKAIQILKKILILYPQNISLLSEIGNAYFNLKDHEKSWKIFSQNINHKWQKYRYSK
jgi:tetratricopeptide (TPR) repeat protein